MAQKAELEEGLNHTSSGNMVDEIFLRRAAKHFICCAGIFRGSETGELDLKLLNSFLFLFFFFF